MAGLLDAVLEARLLHALVEGVRAAWPELAAGRGADERGRRALDRVQPLLPGPVESRDRSEQAPRIRHLRVVEERPRRRPFDDPARVHDEDLVRDVGDDPEVVRDQDHRRVELVFEPVDELEDLRLDRHVERGRRLVGDQHVGVAGERHRDHRPLPHPAGELVRVVLHARVGVGDPDLPEQVDRAPPRLPLVGPLVDLDRLADLRPDGIDGVQRGHRILEDHRHLVAADFLQLVLVHLEHVAALVEHLSLEAGVPVARQAEQRHRGHALAGARLAHDPEHLSA